MFMLHSFCLYILQLDILERNQLASRLTLNCHDSYVEPQKLKDVYVTIMDVSTIILQFFLSPFIPFYPRRKG